ncbi:MAG: hypothetical protein ICV63_11740 [Coleofasciculus sp. Co-bin14]|nr:hypothetical protein [Coleofasciculus sp. Co-bin14]
MTLDPTKDFEQVISDFEKLQADYQAALAAKAAAEDNERRQREAYFQQQQIAYEESQKRDRRCAIVQEFIDQLTVLIEQIEWGELNNLPAKVTSLGSGMDFQLRTRGLRDGR